MMCLADVSSCLCGSNLKNDTDRSPAASHNSLWQGLTAAACANAIQHLTDLGPGDQHTASSSSHKVLESASQDDVRAEPRVDPELETVFSHSSGDKLDQSDWHRAVYMLPVQLLHHTHTLQQSISADTWQMLWSLYAIRNVPLGEA